MSKLQQINNIEKIFSENYEISFEPIYDNDIIFLSYKKAGGNIEKFSNYPNEKTTQITMKQAITEIIGLISENTANIYPNTVSFYFKESNPLLSDKPLRDKLNKKVWLNL